MPQGKVLIAQGGGPTAVINESLVGAALEARGQPGVERVYGARHGVRGIVNETSSISPGNRGGTWSGSRLPPARRSAPPATSRI